MVSMVFSFQSGLLASLKVGDESKEIFSITGTAEITLSLLKMKEQMTSNSISSTMKTLILLKKFQRLLITGGER